jgi:nicotinamidase/pyrazinamidase
MAKVIFWDVDTQQDFMYATGKLAVPGAEDILPALKEVTQYAQDNNITIVKTGDAHDEASVEISAKPNYQTTFPMHCERATQGAAFVPETVTSRDTYTIDFRDNVVDYNKLAKASTVILQKDGVDIFGTCGNPHARAVVQALKPDIAVVYGVASEYCVAAAVMGLARENLKVYVLTDASREISSERKNEEVKKWQAQGVQLATVQDLDAIVRG